MKKPVRMLLLACITALIFVGIQISLTFLLKKDIYMYYFNSFYHNNQFSYMFEWKYVVLFVGAIIISYYCLIVISRKKANKIIPLALLIFILYGHIHSYTAMNKEYKPINTNGLIIGKGNTLKLTFYTSYIDKNAIKVANQLNSLLKEYIDYHKIELHIKFVDLESILILSDSKETTYDEYYRHYGKVKKIELSEQKDIAKKQEYEKRVEIVEENIAELKKIKSTIIPVLYVGDKKIEQELNANNVKKIIEEEIKKWKN